MGRRPRVTREEVLDAARELFGERGFEGTTLAAIGARLGVSPAALLRHEPTKQALFEAAFATPPDAIRLPVEFLARVDAAKEDPAQVLRRVAEGFLPFFEQVLGQTIALWMRSNALAGDAERDPARLPLVFDRDLRPTPPERALVLIEGYLRRASRAGRLRLRDTRSAAVAFLGTLQAYVLLHKVVRAVDPPIPTGRYLDTLIDVWMRGAAPRARKERSS